MKRFYNFLMITILLFSITPNFAVQAQAPSGEWISSFSCLNQDLDNPASITITFYQEGESTASLTYSDVIEAGKSKNYYTPTDPPGVPESFQGSVVVSSSAPLSCSTQNYNTNIGTQASPFRLGASGGFDSNSASPVVYLSQLQKNFNSGIYGVYQSYIAIQNTSTASVFVDIEYTDRKLGSIPTANQTITIPGQSTEVVYLFENALLPDNFLGSAKISSKDGLTPLAVQASIYNDATSYKKAQFGFYNGTPSGESKLYVPYIMRKFYDFNGGITVVNVGTEATSFKIVYSIGRTVVREYIYQHPTLVQPGQLVAFYMPNVAVLNPVDRLTMSERAGSAIIYATDLAGNPTTGKLVANANFRNDGNDPANPNFGGQSATFNAVGDGQKSMVMYIPNIQNQVGTAKFTSGVTVVNTTASPGTCSYKFVNAPSVVWEQPLPGNGIYAVLVSNITGLDVGYSAGLIIECDVEAISIVNLRANASGFWGDSATSSNASIPTTIE